MTLKTIYIKTIGTCNLNCEHCFTSGRNGDNAVFDPIITKKWVQDYIDQFSPDTEFHFEFHGGEPFLVPIKQFREFADHFINNDRITMCANSNLTFKLTNDIVDFIKYYFNNNIGTSWDNWIRWDNTKQYELWKHNVKHLSSLGIKIHLKVSVSKQLIKQSPEWFIEQFNDLGIDNISLERLTVGGNSEHNRDIFPDNEDQDNWYLDLYKYYKQNKPSFSIRTLDILEDKIKMNIVKVDTNCRNCEQHLATINSNGSLGGCPNVASKQKHSTIYQPVSLFLKSSQRIHEIASELTFNNNCIQCDVFHVCGGDCHRLPWQNNRCGGLKNTLRYLIINK